MRIEAEEGPATERNERRIAEYKSLRDEIHTRIQQQQLLLTLTVTALGVVATVAINTKSYDLLLVVPFVTTTFGLLSLEHSRAIGAVGLYIKNTLGGEKGPAEELGNWERSDQRAYGQIDKRISSAVLPMIFLFVVCPVVAAVLAIPSKDVTGPEDWLAGAEIAFVVVLAVIAIHVARRVVKSDPQRKAKSDSKGKSKSDSASDANLRG